MNYSVHIMKSIGKLQNQQIMLVPSEWVQHKNPHKLTKVFISEDESKDASTKIAPALNSRENNNTLGVKRPMR